LLALESCSRPSRPCNRASCATSWASIGPGITMNMAVQPKTRAKRWSCMASVCALSLSRSHCMASSSGCHEAKPATVATRTVRTQWEAGCHLGCFEVVCSQLSHSGILSRSPTRTARPEMVGGCLM
jgi:hypothetical protein